MKLRLKNYAKKSPSVFPGPGTCPDAIDIVEDNDDTFNVERKLGLALLATGVVEEVVAPVVPVDKSVKWELLGGMKSKAVFLRATCPVCHQGHTSENAGPFRHCRRVDEVPDDLAATFKSLTKKREPIVIPAPAPMDLSGF